MMISSTNKGFTLIELSIVLVIIGLLIGTVLVGKNLVRSSQLQSVISEVGDYTKAIQMFKDKYHELPGDMPNATSLWAGTNNGNGDGFIGDYSTTNYAEWYLAWQHLSLAGFIPSNLSGTNPGNGHTSTIAINVPASKLKGAGYTLEYLPPTTGDNGVTKWNGNYGHSLVFGGSTSADITNTGMITPSEALLLDTKMDDGQPGTGKALTQPSPAGCTTNATTYNVSSTTLCSMIFLMGF